MNYYIFLSFLAMTMGGILVSWRNRQNSEDFLSKTVLREKTRITLKVNSKKTSSGTDEEIKHLRFKLYSDHHSTIFNFSDQTYSDNSDFLKTVQSHERATRVKRGFIQNRQELLEEVKARRSRRILLKILEYKSFLLD